MQKTLESVTRSLSGLVEAVTSIISSIDNHTATISVLNDRTARHDSEILILRDAVDPITQALVNQALTFTQVDDKIRELESKVYAAEQDVAELKLFGEAQSNLISLVISRVEALEHEA